MHCLVSLILVMLATIAISRCYLEFEAASGAMGVYYAEREVYHPPHICSFINWSHHILLAFVATDVKCANDQLEIAMNSVR